MKCDFEEKPFELSTAQSKELIKLARFTSRDFFYDLGCASGKVVIEVRKRTKVIRAVGIDNDECEFCRTWPQACKRLKKKDLWTIDFQLADIQDYDYSNATVVYQGTEESPDTIPEYRKRLKKKHVKIITKDVPLVGFLPSDVNRRNRDCWFFLMSYPLKKAKTLEVWIESVLGKEGDLEALSQYYLRATGKRYPKDRTYPELALRDLKRLIRKRF